ncbi:MAG: amino acid ABC transporter permease [Rhodospirillales bacterium]|nr:amino acid ABC transporter permease [Rhodospirillales bacterium]
MQYNWNWAVLITEPYLGWIASGFGWTVAVSCAAWIIAFFLGSAIGVMRTTEIRALRIAGAVYVETFRNIPLLVQMFLWYFVLPEILPKSAGDWLKRDMPLPEYWTAVVCLGTYTAARVAEQVRAGINTIGRGQHFAALAIGLTPIQAYRNVLLPIGYRIIVPPLTSDFLGVFKNSSLALTIGVLELTAQTRQIGEYTFQGFESFTAATLIYLAVTFTVMAFMRRIETRTAIPGMISLGAK